MIIFFIESSHQKSPKKGLVGFDYSLELRSSRSLSFLSSTFLLRNSLILSIERLEEISPKELISILKPLSSLWTFGSSSFFFFLVMLGYHFQSFQRKTDSFGHLVLTQDSKYFHQIRSGPHSCYGQSNSLHHLS